MQRLVFGVGPIGLSRKSAVPRRAFAEYISRALNTEVVVVVASSYPELSGLVTRGEAHVGWLPPALYVRATMALGRELELLTSTLRRGHQHFSGALFVRADGPWESMDDLAGLRIGWVDRDSCSGFLFPRLALLEEGIEPDDFFEDQVVLGSHGAVTRSVASGLTEVGATFVHDIGHGTVTSPGWALEVQAEDMRAVLVSAPIPPDTICATSALPDDGRVRVREALLEMHEDETGKLILDSLFGVERFAPAEPDEYELVRRAMEVLEEDD